MRVIKACVALGQSCSISGVSLIGDPWWPVEKDATRRERRCWLTEDHGYAAYACFFARRGCCGFFVYRVCPQVACKEQPYIHIQLCHFYQYKNLVSSFKPLPGLRIPQPKKSPKNSAKTFNQNPKIIQTFNFGPNFWDFWVRPRWKICLLARWWLLNCRDWLPTSNRWRLRGDFRTPSPMKILLGVVKFGIEFKLLCFRGHAESKTFKNLCSFASIFLCFFFAAILPRVDLNCFTVANSFEFAI